MLLRVNTVALVIFLALSLHAQQQPPQPQSALVIQGLGRGEVKLNGFWQFHTGDDPRWASPSFDDSRWEPITASDSWGNQDHAGYTGFAWYRRHMEINLVPGANAAYALLIPPIDDAYEIYWNGKLIGSYGKLPPRPHWYYTPFFRSFAVPSVDSGTIAIRVWKSPLLFVDSGSLGGIKEGPPPLLGDAVSIAAQLALSNSESTLQYLYDFSLMILYGFVTLLSLLLWSRDRKVGLFLWLGIFTGTPALLLMLQEFLISISYGWGRGLNQPIYALNHISLWFLLLYLLRLDGNRTLLRWTRALAICTFAAGVLDGSLAFFWGSAGPWMQGTDTVLTMIILLVEVFPFVIVAIGVRQRLDHANWVVAISALVSQMIDTIAFAGAAGQRFTHWTLFEIIDRPLLSIHGVFFQAAQLAAIALFISILYAVYRYNTEQRSRQLLLEREMHSAREIQQVLIPEALPSLEGFAITSAYRPALEVGGDFFQIIREESGSTIIALGDVSGKGMKAAMNVSLIVGVLRSLSDASANPVRMLETLNRCLCGRLQGGFVTTVILRLHADGYVTLANAGHLPPFLNQQELEIAGSLPLGLLPSATYDEISILLRPGDQLSLYTDGLLEARSATGELYGFDRLHTLFASRPSAQQASDAAVAFGQDDDITVLTLTRLAAGEESTTSLTTPFLEPATAE
jgi:serine phosphatase RsbU (regulator of sigma subunit)